METTILTSEQIFIIGTFIGLILMYGVYVVIELFHATYILSKIEKFLTLNNLHDKYEKFLFNEKKTKND